MMINTGHNSDRSVIPVNQAAVQVGMGEGQKEEAGIAIDLSCDNAPVSATVQHGTLEKISLVQMCKHLY